MGYCSLNGYLKWFNIVNNAIYSGCGDAEEMVHHFLMVCRKYEKLRDRMRKEVGVGGMKTVKLLGDSRRIKDTVKFIEGTVLRFAVLIDENVVGWFRSVTMVDGK
jgi:hypothetical protein